MAWKLLCALLTANYLAGAGARTLRQADRWGKGESQKDVMCRSFQARSLGGAVPYERAY